MAQFKQGNLKEASAICDQLLSSNSRDIDALKVGGLVAVQASQWSKAVDILERQVKIMPNDPIAYTNLGLALFELARDDEAYTASTQALKLSPNQAEAHNNIGKVLARKNHLEGARESYQKAVSFGKGNPHYSINLASIIDAMGEGEAAEGLYRKVIKQYPGFPPAHNNLALLLSKKRELNEAQSHFDIVLKAEPRNPEVHNNLGLLMLKQGEFAKAEACFNQAKELDPESPNAYINLGLLYAGVGREEESRDYYSQALSLDPDNPSLHVDLGFQLYLVGEQDAAVEHFERALSVNPNHVQALACFGEILLEDGALEKAQRLIDMAIHLGKGDLKARHALAKLKEAQNDDLAAEAEWHHLIEMNPMKDRGYIGLAKLLFSQDRNEEAREVYRQAEGIIQPSVPFYLAWSSLEEHTHNLVEAESLAKKAAEYSAGDVSIAVARSTLARRRKDYQAAIEILDSIDIEAAKSNRVKVNYLFEQGMVLDKLGRYAEAFTAYDAANQSKNIVTGTEYDESRDLKQLASRREVFSEANCLQLAAIASQLPKPDVAPIFILGFPRSGTSLLEQILGSHAEIEPAGELSFIHELGQGQCTEVLQSALQYPACLVDPNSPLTQKSVLELREYYLSRMMALGVAHDGTQWVTDKMPHNSIHMGLIALLFPRSPIIHISRHPLDSCLSTYFSNFGGHRYTSNLENTAKHYQNVMEGIEHFKKVLKMRFIEIRYQDLVDDQEAVVQKLLEFIGVVWDDNCLQHHKSARVVRTASYEQVTQKVYRSSLARYINYWDAVQPCIPIVKPTIDRFNYPLK
ncbi:MAG: tetratricopeptide repeat protein [Aestuariibacter sp.]|nr:tetratricopeptide repeat protein [Aestuariibacter sp.]